ncbi:MAG: Uncharacterized protein G01um101420_2 [Parcubacteria group bacterium Gr01-1014_20]|nr:MAG: Uncharacterized protein G01um101420_2 [Parcubacteria group bacterium Gr01-1014_20]
MFDRNKKWGWVFKNKLALKLGVFISLFSLVIPRVTHAGWLFDLEDAAAWLFGWIMFVVSYLISTIFGFFIAIQAWAIGLLLQIQSAQKIVNLPVVSIGHEMMLSLANLGFVAAIIFIAVATILRLQTYNVKKTLWKLIIAALLVNFSLVFTGAIMNLSDQLSFTFLQQFPGQSPGSTTGFASAITTAFSPQKYLNPQADPEARAAAAANPAGVTEQYAGAISQVDDDHQEDIDGIGQLLAPIFSMVMTVLGLGSIVMVLGAFQVLLLIRYIALSILLVLMPMVWLFWIFPGLSGMWTSWWKNFFRWTFFAPIVLFFVWLVIKTGEAMQAGSAGSPFSGENMNFSSSDPSPLIASISNFLGQTFTPIIGTTLNGFVLVGLMVGGLFAANKLSITGAGAAVSAVKGAGKGAAKGAWGYTKGKATSTLGRPPDQDKAGFKGLMQKMNLAQGVRKRVQDAAKIEQKVGIKDGPATKLAAKGKEAAEESKKRDEMKKEYISRYGEIKGRAAYAVAPGKPSPTLVQSVFIEAARGSGLLGKSQKLTKEQKKMLGLEEREEKEEKPEGEKKPVIIAGTQDAYNEATGGGPKIIPGA